MGICAEHTKFIKSKRYSDLPSEKDVKSEHKKEKSDRADDKKEKDKIDFVDINLSGLKNDNAEKHVVNLFSEDEQILSDIAENVTENAVEIKLPDEYVKNARIGFYQNTGTNIKSSNEIDIKA